MNLFIIYTQRSGADRATATHRTDLLLPQNRHERAVVSASNRVDLSEAKALQLLTLQGQQYDCQSAEQK